MNIDNNNQSVSHAGVTLEGRTQEPVPCTQESVPTDLYQAVCARRSAKNYGCNFHCKKAKWRQNGGEILSVFFLNYPHYFYFKSYQMEFYVAKYNQSFVPIEFYVVVG